MIAKGNSSVTLNDIISKVSEADILAYYLNIYEVPTIINSPLREDRRPSFGLYSLDGKRIFYTDLSTRDRGGLFDLLGSLWGCGYFKVLERINKDIKNISKGHSTQSYTPCTIKKTSVYTDNCDLLCKIREWRDYDLEYWGSYGITLEWLKYAEVYPISHKIVIKDGKRFIFGADKLAYAYVERKDGRVTIKIYQPFNTQGYKWSNRHDGSVISLWTKVPECGKAIVVCSSLKDALTLSANANIPAISLQGEGYSMSKTAIKELKRRYEKVFICLDNDEPGKIDAKKLAEETGFINVELPYFEGGKDIADYRKIYGKDAFLKLIKQLFPLSFNEETFDDELPF